MASCVHTHMQTLEARCLLMSTHRSCSDTVFFACLSYMHLKMNIYILHTLQQPHSRAHVCTGMYTAHTCLEGQFILHLCVSSMYFTESRWGEGRFFWKGVWEMLWAGRALVSDGLLLTVVSFPMLHSPQSGKSLLLQYFSPAGSGYK